MIKFLMLQLVAFVLLIPISGSASQESKTILKPLVEKLVQKLPFESLGGDDILWHCNTDWNSFVVEGRMFSVSIDCQVLGSMYVNKNVIVTGHSDGVYVYTDSIQLSDVEL